MYALAQKFMSVLSPRLGNVLTVQLARSVFSGHLNHALQMNEAINRVLRQYDRKVFVFGTCV